MLALPSTRKRVECVLLLGRGSLMGCFLLLDLILYSTIFSLELMVPFQVWLLSCSPPHVFQPANQPPTLYTHLQCWFSVSCLHNVPLSPIKAASFFSGYCSTFPITRCRPLKMAFNCFRLKPLFPFSGKFHPQSPHAEILFVTSNLTTSMSNLQ